MLDIKYIRENPDKVQKAAENRGYKVNIEGLLKIDDERRALMQVVEEARAEQNKVSKEITKLEGAEKEKNLAEMKKLKEKIKKGDDRLKQLSIEMGVIIRDIPNIPLDDVPIGKDESDNKIVRRVGEPIKFNFKPRDHVELGEMLDLIDTERGGKVSGSRFSYIKNEAVLMQFALIRYATDLLLKKGFTPMLPPVMVKGETMEAMGYLQHGGSDETYFFEKDDLYLVGTSEQSGLPYHMNEILDETELPKRLFCYSTCFRREAGSYGKDVKGILRQHQFDKLEMLCLSTPEKSNDEHEMILAVQEKLMQGLKLPYQVVLLCTGDLGDPSAKTYDIETWMPAQEKYRETHSTSSTTDFQARRLNMRYKKSDGNNEFCHTLNGTAFAMGRTLIAILENYQQEDGSVEIPKVLRPYMNKMKKICPKS